jgi:hypothetical protein
VSRDVHSCLMSHFQEVDEVWFLWFSLNALNLVETDKFQINS